MYTILIGVLLLILIISTIVFSIKYVIGKTTFQTQTGGILILQESKEEINPNNLSFSLFKRGEQKQITNSQIGKTENNQEWQTFNYEYYSKDDNKKNKFTIAKTTISNIPNITINNKKCNHQIGEIFGYKTLTYQNNPQMTNNFTIRSKDDIETFKLLKEEFLNYLQTEITGNIEIENDSIIYYENDNVSPKDTILKLDKIIQLLNK